MSNNPVLLEIKGRIAQITLNRPDNRNSMTAEMMTGFSEVLEQVKVNRDLRCLIIAGSGTSFCAGGDFGGDKKPAEEAPVEPAALMRHESLLNTYRSFLDIARLDIPVIGALTGHAIGGGFGLVANHSLIMANYISRANAGMIDLRQLLLQG